MIEITNDNFIEYITLNGLNELMDSISTGVHVLLLTKKNKLIKNGFTSATRSKDKLSVVTDNDIEFICDKNATLDHVLILTADGKFSLNLTACKPYEIRKSLSITICDTKLCADIPVIIGKIKLGFEG